MKFAKKDNSFELSIIGYQFPNARTELYDSNWLIIQLNISDSQGAWNVADPCLLTYEVNRLANWLDKIDSGNFGRRDCDFTEPVISFHLTEHNQQKYVRIRFTIEALPAWAQNQDEYFIEFPLSEINLKQATNDLRKQLEKYPKRAIR